MRPRSGEGGALSRRLWESQSGEGNNQQETGKVKKGCYIYDAQFPGAAPPPPARQVIFPLPAGLLFFFVSPIGSSATGERAEGGVASRAPTATAPPPPFSEVSSSPPSPRPPSSGEQPGAAATGSVSGFSLVSDIVMAKAEVAPLPRPFLNV